MESRSALQALAVVRLVGREARRHRARSGSIIPPKTYRQEEDDMADLPVRAGGG